MAENWAENVKKYVPDADDGIIAGIVRYCGIALQKRDSSLVSFGDPVETGRVRENFLKKKLALTDADDILDAAIADIGKRMDENFKNRVTVYYLLAERFGKLDLFQKKGAADPGASTAAAGGAAAASGAAALGIASLGGGDGQASEAGSASASEGSVSASAAPAPTPAPVSAPEPSSSGAPQPLSGSTGGSGAGASSGSDDGGGDLSWLWWLLLAAIVGFLIWWLFCRDHAGAPEPANPAPVVATSPAAGEGDAVASNSLSSAPAEGSVEIPAGAGVTSELRDGKPVVKVYFDTGKTDVAEAFAPAAGGLKSWLEANAGSSLAVSGYSDPSGNAAINAEISKNRAIAVRKALIAAGIPEGSVALVKPEEISDGTVSPEAARRVEVVVR